MPTVYLADDLKHERKVAPKVLKAEAFFGQGRPTTAFLVYSRGWPEDDFRADWVAQL